MAGMSPAEPLRVVLVGSQNGVVLTGAASGSAHTMVDCSSYPYLTLYVISTAALSAGTLILEERDQPQDVPGTIVTITLSTPFASTGGTYAYHITPSASGYISARIGTSAVGGLVAAVLRAT